MARRPLVTEMKARRPRGSKRWRLDGRQIAARKLIIRKRMQNATIISLILFIYSGWRHLLMNILGNPGSHLQYKNILGNPGNNAPTHCVFSYNQWHMKHCCNLLHTYSLFLLLCSGLTDSFFEPGLRIHVILYKSGSS